MPTAPLLSVYEMWITKDTVVEVKGCDMGILPTIIISLTVVVAIIAMRRLRWI